jgi:succinate--hydroxymethylglutarate CoA-transferase
VLDQPDLPDDARFTNAKQRLQNRPPLKALIEDILVTQPASYWLDRMRHLPAGRVRTLDDALRSGEVIARDMVQTVTDEDGSEAQLLGSNFKFQETPLLVATQPPRYGAHTDDVLSELLGFDNVRLDALRASGIIR